MKLKSGLLCMVVAMAWLVGCWSPPEEDDSDQGTTALCDACLNAAPDPNSLEITIPEDEDKNAQKALGEMAEYYDFTVDVSRDLNFWILGTLSTVDEILTYPPTQSDGSTCTWGPFIPDGLSPVEVRFSMTKNSDTDYEYLWDERLKNTEDDFTPAWGGHITPATDSVRRGVGDLFIDYSALHALDATWDVSGRIDVEYDTYTDGRRIEIAFTDFVTEEAGYPADGEYFYHNHADNSGEFRFAFEMDFALEDDENTAVETMDQTTYWHEDGEGVSTQVISGGDLTGYEVFGKVVDHIEGYECWNNLFQRVYFSSKIIFDDATEQALDETEGDIADCASF